MCVVELNWIVDALKVIIDEVIVNLQCILLAMRDFVDRYRVAVDVIVIYSFENSIFLQWTGTECKPLKSSKGDW